MSLLFSSSSSSSSSSTGVFDPNAGESQTYINQQEWYDYQPNVAFALFSTIAFAVLGVALLVQCIRSRQWWTGILALAAWLEFSGYLTRYIVTQGGSNPVFIYSYIAILVTPNFLALVNYAAVGRLIALLPTKPCAKTWLRIPIITNEYGLFRGERIAAFFFLSDVLAFFIQASAAAFLTSDNPSTINNGLTIIKIGLAWALVFVALFFFVTLYIYFSPKYDITTHPDVAVIRLMYRGLIITITLLLIRLIYRMVEFVNGNKGYIATHEVFFGIFDTGLMLLACAAYCWWYYGFYLPQIHLPASKDAPAGVEMEHVVQVTPMHAEGQVVVVHGADE